MTHVAAPRPVFRASLARWLAAALLGIAALAAPPHLARPALAESRPAYGGDIIGSLLSEPIHLDPLLAKSHAELTLVTLLFDSLYRVEREPDGTIRPVPHLAASLPELAPDGSEARIALRPGVTFHDGRPVTAQVVARSLTRTKEGRAGWLAASMRDIRAQKDTVVITLSRPTPELAVLLATPASSITIRGGGSEQDGVIGTGPFTLRSIDRSRRRVNLRAHDQYFAGRPYIDKAQLVWFDASGDEAATYEAGKSHLSQRGAVAYSDHQPKFQTSMAMADPALLVYVGFCSPKQRGALTALPAFRQALSLAVNRRSLRGIGAGEQVLPTIDPVPPLLGGPVAPESQLDPQVPKAKQTLGRAAVAAGPAPLGILIDQTRLDDGEIAEKVAAALFEIGIKARIERLDARAFATRVAEDACDLYIGQLVPPAPSGELMLAAALAAGDSAGLKAALAKAAFDLVQARRMFLQTLPIVPLFHRAVRAHHRSDLIGVTFAKTTLLLIDELFFFGKPTRAGVK